MDVFVEYMARPAPARGRARLVAAHADERGERELCEMLDALGLRDYERHYGAAGHAYAAIALVDVVRAMHAGAVPVERTQIDSLLQLGRMPNEVQDRPTASSDQNTAAN